MTRASEIETVIKDEVQMTNGEAHLGPEESAASSCRGTDLLVWGQYVPTSDLNETERQYLEGLPKGEVPTVQWVWDELDRVWEEMGLRNDQPLSPQRIGDYYSHSVWLMNGIFTAIDPDSVAHRLSLASHVQGLGAQRIAEIGGGIGELALEIGRSGTTIGVDLVEPYASALLRNRCQGTKVRVIAELGGQYDLTIAQDVLEHVEEPLAVVRRMIEATKLGGHLIFANCFQAVIKCHLPSTFYLRHLFPFVVEPLGLHYLGRVPGAAHAQVFRRESPGCMLGHLKRDKIARHAGPALNSFASRVAPIKRRLGFVRGAPI